MAPCEALVCNDAPWLAKDAANLKRPDGFLLRFVHPRISAGVGERVGIQSLRLLLATASSTAMDFDLGIAIESCGQSEPITRRLRNILELYPEV